MQTFLPYASYDLTGIVLDHKRLGNQVYREAKTIVNGGWSDHPVSKMWDGHFYELCIYAQTLAKYIKNITTATKWYNYFDNLKECFDNTGPPYWMGKEVFHATHRSNLLRKDPVWYGQFGWTEPDNLPYIWPL